MSRALFINLIFLTLFRVGFLDKDSINHSLRSDRLKGYKKGGSGRLFGIPERNNEKRRASEAGGSIKLSAGHTQAAVPLCCAERFGLSRSLVFHCRRRSRQFGA